MLKWRRSNVVLTSCAGWVGVWSPVLPGNQPGLWSPNFGKFPGILFSRCTDTEPIFMFLYSKAFIRLLELRMKVYLTSYFNVLSDIDECSSSLLNHCEQICLNTNGTFNCSCDVGYELLPDKVNCKRMMNIL